MDITTDHVRDVYSKAMCLYKKDEVEQAITRMAEEISDCLIDSNPLVISVMNGGLILTGYLLTMLDFPLQVDYLHATRYRDKTTGSELDWIIRPQHSLRDRTVLVVDDILDEGITLDSIMEYCRSEGVSRVYSCVLVDKAHDRKPGYNKADFTGLTVGDKYVFGFGMDYKGYLRNAPGIYAVNE